MIIACCLFKFFPYGGLSRDFRRIALALLAKGHTVRAYVQKWQGERIDGVEIFEYSGRAFTNDGAVHEYCRFVKESLRLDPVDVVLGFNKMPGLDFYFVADVCYVNKVESEKKGIKKLLYKQTRRYKTFSAMERSVFGEDSKTKILFLDKTQEILFKNFYDLSMKDIIWLPIGLSDKCRRDRYTQSQIEAFKAELGLDNDTKLILQVGSDFKRKGLDRTIKAIASLPSEFRNKVRLFVIGEDDVTPFQKLAKEEGISELVRFAGGTSTAYLAMCAADILLHPAYVENTGTVILEALALHLPVITTENCGFSHYVKEYNAGAVLNSPFSQAELNTLLNMVLSNTYSLEKYRFAARNFCATLDLYSMVDVVVKNLEHFVWKSRGNSATPKYDSD